MIVSAPLPIPIAGRLGELRNDMIAQRRDPRTRDPIPGHARSAWSSIETRRDRRPVASMFSVTLRANLGLTLTIEKPGAHQAGRGGPTIPASPGRECSTPLATRAGRVRTRCRSGGRHNPRVPPAGRCPAPPRCPAAPDTDIGPRSPFPTQSEDLDLAARFGGAAQDRCQVARVRAGLGAASDTHALIEQLHAPRPSIPIIPSTLAGSARCQPGSPSARSACASRPPASPRTASPLPADNPGTPGPRAAPTLRPSEHRLGVNPDFVLRVRVGPQGQEVEQVVKVGLPIPLRVSVQRQIHPSQFPRQPLAKRVDRLAVGILVQHRRVVVVIPGGVVPQQRQDLGRLMPVQHIPAALPVAAIARPRCSGAGM